MSNCKICDGINSGQVRFGVILRHYGFRGKCDGCGGDIHLITVDSSYLFSTTGSHVFRVVDGSVTNCCGRPIDKISIQCNDEPIDVTKEFEKINVYVGKRRIYDSDN